jgi:hypothetical protein
MPGKAKGKVRTYWLAPYVGVTHWSVGTTESETVRWFDRDGKLLREVSGPYPAQPNYVCVHSEKTSTVYPVSGDWRISLPHKGSKGSEGACRATADSRTFVHQFHPKQGEIAADIYVAGKRASTIGPFPQLPSRREGLVLGADGSVALLVAKASDDTTPQVVVVGPDGKLRFRVACERPGPFPQPAPGGAGVLVQHDAEQGRSQAFDFYTGKGKVSSLKVGAGFVVAWLPGTAWAVMSTSVGYKHEFHLIDWGTGRRLWTIADPLAGRVEGDPIYEVDATRERLLFAGREQLQVKDRKVPVRRLYAVAVKTGRVVAHWLPEPVEEARDGGRFVRLGKELYLVGQDEFSLIDEADIAAHRRGWKAPAQDEKDLGRR